MADAVYLKMNRLDSGDESTCGILYNTKGNRLSWTLEDEYREVKIAGDTRIGAGCYQILKRRVDSPKTLRYREKFDWFDYHLELQNVPDFTYVYIHIGNDDEDTEGCILTGEGLVGLADGNYRTTNSTGAYERVYKYISKLLDEGVEVFVDIYDN